jgi:hypothetical protein
MRRSLPYYYHAVTRSSSSRAAGAPSERSRYAQSVRADHGTFPFEQDLQYRWHITAPMVKIARVLGL